MTVFPGFTLPEELRLLGDQIRRFVQDEIIPLEQTIDPDAPEIPREDFVRLSAKTKAAGLWTLGAREEYGLLEWNDLILDEPSDLIAEQAQLLREREAGEHRHGGGGSSRP